MRRPHRPRPPGPPPVSAGYELPQHPDTDVNRAAAVLVAARRQGRERDAAAAVAKHAAQTLTKAIDQMRAAVARGGRA